MSKIFISYKYKDCSVPQDPDSIVSDLGYTSPRCYVDILDKMLSTGGHICKAEKPDEPLVGMTRESIKKELSNRLYDSTITIVLISKKMVEPHQNEEEQWIPWEVSYSLSEHSRGGRTSATNAMIGIVLPDEHNLYDYFVTKHDCQTCRATQWHEDKTFEVIGKNMFNKKNCDLRDCNNPYCNIKKLHFDPNHSYIEPVLWHEFVMRPDHYIKQALQRKEQKENYKHCKRLI